MGSTMGSDYYCISLPVRPRGHHVIDVSATECFDGDSQVSPAAGCIFSEHQPAFGKINNVITRFFIRPPIVRGCALAPTKRLHVRTLSNASHPFSRKIKTAKKKKNFNASVMPRSYISWRAGRRRTSSASVPDDVACCLMLVGCCCTPRYSDHSTSGYRPYTVPGTMQDKRTRCAFPSRLSPEQGRLMPQNECGGFGNISSKKYS